MTKTKPEIAKAIIERRNRMTHIIMPGDINAAIGPDGVAEALKERWLVVDQESGCLSATNDLHKVEEMRKLAEMPPDSYRPESVQASGGHDLALQHTKRKIAINEVAPPATGQPSPGLTSIAQPNNVPPQPHQPPPPSPAVAPSAGGAQGPFTVGTPVTAARQGISANGVIEKLLPDGRYSVGYPATVTQKPPGDNIFSKEEISPVQQKAA